MFDGVIRVGDTTSHGGTVLTGSSSLIDNGNPVARVGDQVQCPVHGTVTIIEGAPTVLDAGRQVALQGCCTSCGATLMVRETPTTWVGNEAGSNARQADTLGEVSSDVASAKSLIQPYESEGNSRGEKEFGDVQALPIVNMAEGRWESIVNNTPAIFEIADNSHASGREPWYEFEKFDEVDGNEQAFEAVGREVGVDPRLLKSIAYIETTHGYYDRVHPRNASFRPMNINYEYWKPIADELGFTRYEVVNYPYPNIYVAAVLLERIQARVIPSSIEKVASVYNALGAEHVSDYGARVRSIYDQELWEGGSE